MKKSFQKILQGYQTFRKKYALGDESVMKQLSDHGQHPEVMIVSCCDSRVDPAVILQCDPGDVFVVRNVANIIPPYEAKTPFLGTGAALEFAINFLQVKHLILLGHSQCGGIQALLNPDMQNQTDFISKWVSVIKLNGLDLNNADESAKQALKQSLDNCMTFPWVQTKLKEKKLKIHLWYFDIKIGEIFTYSDEQKTFQKLKAE